MQDVIVAGSNYATTLGIVRAVGMAGFGVRLLCTVSECARIIRRSRYVVKSCTCEDYDLLYRALEKLRGSDKKMLVIPTSDPLMMTLDKHAEKLSDRYIFPCVSGKPDALAKLMNKKVQKELAVSCGLSVAEGEVYPVNEHGIRSVLAEAAYPCVIKAVDSVNHIRSKDLFTVCHNEDDLKKAMGSASENQWTSVLVERFLEIEKEYAVYGLAVDGKVLMPACLHTWRSGHGAHKGVTAEGVMLSSDFLGEDKIRLEEFVLKSGMNGLFCIDLILSKEKIYFVEINLRYGASGWAVTMAGVNLPGMYARVMTEGGSIDEKSQLKYEPRFLNEKVELDDYRGGYMSWKEYKEHAVGEKVRFMKSEDDPDPWRRFRLHECRKFIARLVKGTKKGYRLY